MNYKLILKRDINEHLLCRYVDSDLGGHMKNGKSTTGYTFKLLDCIISWTSKKQQCVSISSTEAEFALLWWFCFNSDLFEKINQ